MATPPWEPARETPSPLTETLRPLGGLLCAALAALVLLPPSAASSPILSMAVRVATEFGYCLAAPAILVLLPGWRRTSAGRIGGLLTVAGLIVLAKPTIGAIETSERLPGVFADRFGAETRVRHRFAPPAREVPFVVTELFRPVKSKPVRYQRVSLAQPDGSELDLDIFFPPYVHDRIPAVIMLHGESWAGGVGTRLGALDGYLAARDYIVVAITSRLAAQRTLEGARADVAATLAYLKAHAAELGVDPTRLAIMGRAVAGQLALLVSYTATDPALRGVIALYPPSDLSRWYATAGDAPWPDTRSLLEHYLGAPPEHAPEVYEASSPIERVDRRAPPTLLVHGTRDGLIPPDQSERLQARLEEVGGQHVLIRLPWATHVCDQNFAGPCGQITTYAVERFLDAVMRKPTTTATRAGRPDAPDRNAAN